MHRSTVMLSGRSWGIGLGCLAILTACALALWFLPDGEDGPLPEPDAGSAQARLALNVLQDHWMIPSGDGWTDFLAAGTRACNPRRMVWIPPGKFWMGEEHEKRHDFQDAKPAHEVELDGFWIDATEVTNAQFAEFVAATRFVTEAERRPDPADFPGVARENLLPFSIVFSPPKAGSRVEDERDWQVPLPGANWRQPEGPGSTIKGRDHHPVVHICWNDAMAYAQWAGKRLLTEAEWEYAARGGLDRKRYAWGDDFRPGGRWMANVWQGMFPIENSREDGYERSAPVASYPPNGYGVYDMSGNVWEWCADWFRPDYYTQSPRKNPPGPTTSWDPAGRDDPYLPKRVQRGGSFLCAEGSCSVCEAGGCIRYLPGGRGKGEVKSGASHIGFRCAWSEKSKE